MLQPFKGKHQNTSSGCCWPQEGQQPLSSSLPRAKHLPLWLSGQPNLTWVSRVSARPLPGVDGDLIPPQGWGYSGKPWKNLFPWRIFKWSPSYRCCDCRGKKRRKWHFTFAIHSLYIPYKHFLTRASDTDSHLPWQRGGFLLSSCPPREAWGTSGHLHLCFPYCWSAQEENTDSWALNSLNVCNGGADRNELFKNWHEMLPVIFRIHHFILAGICFTVGKYFQSHLPLKNVRYFQKLQWANQLILSQLLTRDCNERPNS